MVQVVAFSAVVSGDNHSSAAEARKSRDVEMQLKPSAMPPSHIQATAVRLIEFDSVTWM